MRYNLIVFTILVCSCFVNTGGKVNAQTVTQPGLRDYQISGATLPDSILFILGTDTLDGSAKQGLAKFYRADSLFAGIAGDQDWYKKNTTLIPLNADSMYRTGWMQVQNGIESLNEDANYAWT